jgi:hypothetical protein
MAGSTINRRTGGYDLTASGRSSFDWAVLFAALALVFPVSGLVGVAFADRSRRRGYARWRSALGISIWCVLVGCVLRAFLHVEVFP